MPEVRARPPTAEGDGRSFFNEKNLPVTQASKWAGSFSTVQYQTSHVYTELEPLRASDVVAPEAGLDRGLPTLKLFSCVRYGIEFTPAKFYDVKEQSTERHDTFTILQCYCIYLQTHCGIQNYTTIGARQQILSYCEEP